MRILLRQGLFLTFAIVLLSACGGGGSSDTPAANTPQASAPGAYLIFSRSMGTQQDDLYVIRENGTGELALASTTDNEVFLAVTSDGRLVYERYAGVFPGLRDIYSVKLDGSDRRTVAMTPDHDEFVTITPMGRVIFNSFTPTTNLDLNAVNADGTQGVVLANSTDREQFNALTSSGKVIYTATHLASGVQTLYSVNLDGTGRVELVAGTLDRSAEYGYSGGGRVAFNAYTADGNDAYVTGENGGTPIPLAAAPMDSESVAGVTSTGQVIVSIQRAGESQSDLYIVDGTGGPLRPLATSQASEMVIAVTADRVVFYVFPSPTNYDIYSIRFDGTGLTPLANSTDSESLYHLTSSGKLVFVRSVGAHSDIYAINADGTQLATVANSADLEDFLGMQGNLIVFRRRSGNLSGLYTYNVDTASTATIESMGGSSLFQGFTPNGRVILGQRPGTSQQLDLFIVNADGSGMRSFANAPTSELFQIAVP